MSRFDPDLSHPDDVAERDSLDETWRASDDMSAAVHASYGAPPDDEISADVWSYVHAQFNRPTSDRSFYTCVGLLEVRHRRERDDLLAALKCLRRAVYDLPNDWPPGMHEAYRAATAAVDRAEGMS